MTDLQSILCHIDELELDDLKIKYEVATKMLFALIESIGENCNADIENKVFKMFESLTGELDK